MGIEHMIDHTMLKADAGKDTIIRYCNEAREHKFASVCVNTCFVPLVAEELKGSGVKTCCVAGKNEERLAIEADAKKIFVYWQHKQIASALKNLI